MWANDPAVAADTYRFLAEKYGTPLYVYDGSALTGALRELSEALHPAMEVFYSLKANPNITLAGLLAVHGARAEVSSLVELRTALRAGFRPQDVIFLGPGKSTQELAACVEAGIYAAVVESFDELGELDRLAAARGVRQAALIRINPREAGNGSRLTMGGKPRQFGIDEEQVLAAGPLAERYPALDVIGVHAYLGTRILDATAVVDNTARVLELAERVAEATGIDLRAVDVGGGLGVAYFEKEEDPDLGVLRAGLRPLVESFRRRHPDTRLLFESGRYLAARAGVYAVSVRGVKESMGRQFAVTDGGTHHHMAAVGVGSYVRRNFPVRLLSRPDEPPTGAWQLTGPLCTPNDTIAKDVELPELRPGDLIGILRSGAYGPTASPGLFLSHGFPAEVLLHQGRDYLVRDRDLPEDLLRKQHHHEFDA
ncbi:type III PLP-dependent enzyme [Actinospica robiniae]|uniref:type III PLP-dependent enzyme n=1 Tax=Actinospica robiniae TaxID=304901 RepID=UPI0004270162|nr:type III PLP-dependent enzyme [Actinospica robiniae]